MAEAWVGRRTSARADRHSLRGPDERSSRWRRGPRRAAASDQVLHNSTRVCRPGEASSRAFGPAGQGGRSMAGSPKPVTVQYFYKVRWGFEDEFEELFERNHWPLL